MSQILKQPEKSLEPCLDGRWITIIYNNDTTPMLVVVHTIKVLTGCDQQEAEIETWEAHHFGKASVHFSTKDECTRIAEGFARINVQASVHQEWGEESC